MASMGSGAGNSREGRGQWSGHASPVSGASGAIRMMQRSGTSLATAAKR